jgi:recombination DNA repair RAD52 pathway protein
LVYITGKVTVELNGKLYTHSDLGRCIFTGDTPEALDMALAGSATDCLKRCFRQLGEQFGNCALWHTMVVFLTQLGRAGRTLVGQWLTWSRKAMGTVACH